MAVNPKRLDRRAYLKGTAAGVGAAAAVGATSLEAAKTPEKPNVDADKLIWRSKAPDMAYVRLGRTNFMTSKIVAGWGGDDAQRRRMLARGINCYDNALGYGDYEVEMKAWLGKNRDKIWLTSKATDVAGYGRIDAGVEKLYRAAMKSYLGESQGDLLQLHKAAVKKQKKTGEKPDLRPVGKLITELYLKKLDESLGRMGVDDVDCYMVHGIEIPWIFDCTELWDTYLKVHKAGKVKHFGFSVHKHHKEVLAAAADAEEKGPWKLDLIMPGINPGSFDDLKPELKRLKKRDIGIIAMKTTGIKNRPVDGREKKFQKLVGGKKYNEWERAKLWMLNLNEGLVDAVIIAMKSNENMEKDIPLATVKMSAAAERELRTLVKYEMAGACHLCGHCETNCPEHIAVTDMIRYHAYVHQYNEKDLARELYDQAGYDPSHLCTNCGRCTDVCASNVRIMELLNELSADMA